MRIEILTEAKTRIKKNGEKIKIHRSINGELYEEVILDKELADSLYQYNETNRTFIYLLIKGFLNDELKTNLTSIIRDCEKVFIKYNLSKHHIRGDYKFHESKVI